MFHKIETIRLVSFLLFLFCFTGCEYDRYSPVYLDWTSFRNSTQLLEPREIISQGKIYATETALFISEPNVGIHIIDNSDVSNPVKTGFLRVFGNLDMAGKDNYLYADSFVDLLVFDISDINNITLVRRELDVFPYDAYQTFSGMRGPGSYNSFEEYNKKKGVIIGWVKN